MREQLVAWAGDCVVRGSVELGDGRLSDRVNELDVVTFYDVTLRSLRRRPRGQSRRAGGRARRAARHRGPWTSRRPGRRLRTVEERVTLELGPFEVTGNLHRPPHTHSLASLSRWAHFVPLTDALVGIRDRDDERVVQPVVLVNRGRIGKTRTHTVVPVFTDGPARPPPPRVPPRQNGRALAEPWLLEPSARPSPWLAFHLGIIMSSHPEMTTRCGGAWPWTIGDTTWAWMPSRRRSAAPRSKSSSSAPTCGSAEGSPWAASTV